MSSRFFSAMGIISTCLVGVVAMSSSSASMSGCTATLTPANSVKATVASGYQVALVATGLTAPRSIEFDGAGNLLVVQQGKGVTALTFKDDGGTCLSVNASKDLVLNAGLNHGLALSQDGKTLYASTPEAAYSWIYNPQALTVSNTNTTLVTGMNTEDHTTRTLLISRKANDTLLISRGSTANIDPMAEILSSGHSQVKSFDLNNLTADGYDFDSEGLRLGWGLRNSVGVSEHPMTGGIWTVENSVDELTRNGVDIHQDNPAEEGNYLGKLINNTDPEQGSNFGYPYCFTAWKPGDIPENSNLSVGSPFAIGQENSTINDTYCNLETTPPRLSFQAHMAPLDIVFNNSGTEAWVTFHGSWDRTNPVGYKLSVIPFENGEPVAGPNNNTATTDIFANANNSVCPTNCFRPVGIAFDNQGRLYVSSDATGEIYVVVKNELANSTSSTTGGGVPSAKGSALGRADSRKDFKLGILTLALFLFSMMY